MIEVGKDNTHNKTRNNQWKRHFSLQMWFYHKACNNCTDQQKNAISLSGDRLQQKLLETVPLSDMERQPSWMLSPDIV